MLKQIENTHISHIEGVITPQELKTELSLSQEEKDNVIKNRQTIENILSGEDKRFLCIVGPCSIHDYEQAITYAEKLSLLAEKVKDKIFIVMRVYFEKPRTTVGWKGMINDPELDGSFQLEKGMWLARKLMKHINQDTKLAIGTEALDPISPQYLNDLVSWSAIGARTTESQTHREMASGLSCPVGFKNGTDGSIDIAINAMLSAQCAHSFFGINESGKVAIIHTLGNKHAHIILRGGDSGPNYEEAYINKAQNELLKAHLPCNIIVDCSHANSNKNYKN